MVDVAQQLRSWTIDWNGAPMVDGEPPRDGFHCDLLRNAADEIERLRQNDQLQMERAIKAEADNERLRAENEQLKADNTKLLMMLTGSGQVRAAEQKVSKT